MPNRRTRRNQKGGFLDWLFGKKPATTAPVMPNGATAPVINAKPENATAVKITNTASPAVGGRRKKTHRKAHRKANRKAHRKAHTKSHARKSRKSRSSRRNY